MTQEKETKTTSGALMLVVTFLLWGGFIGSLVWLIGTSHDNGGPGNTAIQVIALFSCLLLGILVLPGFFVVQPNMSRVLVLFGDYKGTVKHDGFYWTNPFM